MRPKRRLPRPEIIAEMEKLLRGVYTKGMYSNLWNDIWEYIRDPLELKLRPPMDYVENAISNDA